MEQAAPISRAPGELEFVRAFVNTLDIEANVDQLRDLAAWRVWAASYGIDGQASARDLESARDLRESLREAMLANHERSPLPAHTAKALSIAAEMAQVTVQFGADGARLSSPSAGIDGVLGRVVVSVAAAMNDGTWSRLKACVNDECQWGFYDHSRSRTGQWCSMTICGNRAKQARWRGQTNGGAGTDRNTP